MAARSSSSSFPPSSPAPRPPTRHLGPWTPRVGRGVGVHAVRSEASGLADTVQEGVVDKSDRSWQGEEGAGGRRGPGRAAAVQAPLLSSPVGSRPLEGISVEEAMVTRTQLLEDELSSLKEELALCQDTDQAGFISVCRGWFSSRGHLQTLSFQEPKFSVVTVVVLGAAGVECSPGVENTGQKMLIKNLCGLCGNDFR